MRSDTGHLADEWINSWQGFPALPEVTVRVGTGQEQEFLKMGGI